MDNEEIKLEFFADDLTVFLRNYTSLNALLETVGSFTLCSGLKINYQKKEVMLLGNNKQTSPTPAVSADRNITIKWAIRILGVHFTYDQALWKMLNFDEILKSIRVKLQF